MFPSRLKSRLPPYGSPSVCSRFGNRVWSLFLTCDVRSFVLLIGFIIIVANVALLVQLNPTSNTLAQRPSGGPVESSEIAAHLAEERREQEHRAHPSLIRSRTQGISSLVAAVRKSGGEPTQTITPSTPAVPVKSVAPVGPVALAAERQLSPAERIALWQKQAVSECDRHFGNGFTAATSVCENPSGSSLSCKTNPLTGSMNCDARDILVDLSKLQVARGGEPIESVRGRAEGDEFVRYSSGAFQLNCARDGAPLHKASFPHHLGDMARAIEFASTDRSAFEARCERWIEEPALFVTRYEYANLYHSIGDFYNAYQAQWMSGVDDTTSPIHVIFFDGHSAGALDDVWTTLFGPRVTFVRGLPEEYGAGTRFCFRRAVFVSPAYKSALGVDMMHTNPPVDCAPHPALADFSDAMVTSFLTEILDPSSLFPAGAPISTDVFGREIFPSSLDLTTTPLVTVVLRKDYLAHPRLASLAASRKVANEAALGVSLARVATNTRAHVIAVDFAQLNFAQQLLLVRYSSVLVGVHGAGLSHTLFLAPGAGLIELVPPEYSARIHFKYFAAWNGRAYVPVPIGSETGRGHVVDTTTIESVIGGMVAPSGGEQAGFRHYRIAATKGYIASRSGAAVAESTPTPAAPVGTEHSPVPEPEPASNLAVRERSVPSYTPGMVSNPLPPVVEKPFTVDPTADQGEDLGTSRNDGHRLCIIVPFRDSTSPTSQGANRTGNLMQMIPHMINHLENTGHSRARLHACAKPAASGHVGRCLPLLTHFSLTLSLPSSGLLLVRDFELIVVEQTAGRVFNKGALFNIGYEHSVRAGCDYLALHDVDQVPLSPKNTYRYPAAAPVHLCSASSQYGFSMAYGTMVGGALLLTVPQFERVNGYSNFYWGWGQEDDDFYYRLTGSRGPGVNRLSAAEGRYQALSHPRVKDLDVTRVFTRGTDHLTATRTGRFDIQTDGISNLRYQLVAVERWPQWPRGVRKFVADLQFDNMPKDLDGRAE